MTITTASILIHNSPLSQIRDVLSCLLRSEIRKIWIIYNGGNVRIEEDLRSLCHDISPDRIEVFNAPNDGYGAGHNRALRMAIGLNADFHLVANADTRWEGDVIAPLTDYLRKHTNVGLVAPLIFYPDGSLQASARMLPTPAQLFLRRFLPFLKPKADSLYLLEDLDPSVPVNVPYLLGCFMLFRCEALKKEGLFDERFFMYPEDIDITRRIHRNWRTMRIPFVRIIHDHARESKRNLKLLRIHLVNMIRYFNKWGWRHDKERTVFNTRIREEYGK